MCVCVCETAESGSVASKSAHGSDDRLSPDFELRAHGSDPRSTKSNDVPREKPHVQEHQSLTTGPQAQGTTCGRMSRVGRHIPDVVGPGNNDHTMLQQALHALPLDDNAPAHDEAKPSPQSKSNTTATLKSFPSSLTP